MIFYWGFLCALILLLLASGCHQHAPASSTALTSRPQRARSAREDDRQAPAHPSPPEPSSDDRSTAHGSQEEHQLHLAYSGRQPLSVIQGDATWYSDSLAGRRTASGEPYDPRRFTAAHPSLPFGTVVRVRPLHRQGWVIVRVNDRGPVGHSRRILDLSRAAAERIGLIRPGVLPVRVEILEYGKGSRRRRR